MRDVINEWSLRVSYIRFGAEIEQRIGKECLNKTEQPPDECLVVAMLLHPTTNEGDKEWQEYSDLGIGLNVVV